MEKLYLILFLIITLFFPADGYSRQALFGKNETKSDNIEIFPKWLSALQKNTNEKKLIAKNCESGSKKLSCNYYEWQSFLQSIKNDSKEKQLEKVNDYANKHKYVNDVTNWGVEDYWESPNEFLQKNGDCEDYAIIKYMSLLKLGFLVDNLKIVVLNDSNLGLVHAVLAVNKDGKNFILDNQISKVTTDDRIFHYSPIYSINQKSWWKYI